MQAKKVGKVGDEKRRIIAKTCCLTHYTKPAKKPLSHKNV